MRKLYFPGLCVAVVLVLTMAAGLSAFEPMRGYCPETPHDPTIWDGKATNWEEWAWAGRFPNWFNDGTYPNAGFFYHEHKHGWQAVSSSGHTAFYPGVVYFLAHDIEGEPPPSNLSMFRQRDSNDWNVAEFTFEGINVKAWVFGGDDAEVDTAWIKLSDGLQNSHLIPEVGGNNLINDAETSFIVRVYDDPTTDVHWFPGDPEPGDPGWDWSDYYGVFASYGFNNSFFTTGLDPRAGYEGSNEVYEWAFYWGHPGDEFHPDPDTVFLPQGPAPPVLDSLEILVVVIDPPKDTIVYIAPNWWIHFWPPIDWQPYEVNCMPSQDIMAEHGDIVEVNYYIRNMGLEPTDTYTATITDTKGWELEPEMIELSLASEAWAIEPVTVTIPPEGFLAEYIVDTVIMTVQSAGDETVVRAGSLTVTVEEIGIGEQEFKTPTAYRLTQNSPNPFTSLTAIPYQIPQESEVSLVIYDAAGRVVRTLVDESRKVGYHTAYWDGRDAQGVEVPTGVYFCRFRAGDYRKIRKMILLR
ncbi:T9SS type A sorting domain-containing protein [candidate division WOR-3 bacterium]|nr:T9SS type A sorting domain-containing protein [candidate division WOR-3 bacterium]